MQWVHNELSHLKVLIINAYPELRTIIRWVLSDIGIHEAYGAEDSSRALRLIPEIKPDMAILDGQISPGSGTSFTKFLRSNASSPHPDLPIVLVSSFWGKDVLFKARDAGASEIVAKPFTANALQSHVKAAMHKRPIIATGRYVGPDRRRMVKQFFGPERRRRKVAA